MLRPAVDVLERYVGISFIPERRYKRRYKRPYKHSKYSDEVSIPEILSGINTLYASSLNSLVHSKQYLLDF